MAKKVDLEIMIQHDYANPGKVNVVKVFHFPRKIDLLKTFKRDFKTDAGEVFVLDWKCEDDQWAQPDILRMLQAHLLYGGFLHYTTKTLVWCEPSWGVHGSLQDIIVADLIH